MYILRVQRSPVKALTQYIECTNSLITAEPELSEMAARIAILSQQRVWEKNYKPAELDMQVNVSHKYVIPIFVFTD